MSKPFSNLVFTGIWNYSMLCWSEEIWWQEVDRIIISMLPKLRYFIITSDHEIIFVFDISLTTELFFSFCWCHLLYLKMDWCKNHLFWSVWIEFWSFLSLILNNSMKMSHVWAHSSFCLGDTWSLAFFDFHMIPTCVFLQIVSWTHTCRHLFIGDSYSPVSCSSLCRILLPQHFRTVE